MKCDEVPLFELARDLLPSETRREVLAHVSECQTCRERLQVMLLLDAGRLGDSTAQPDRSKQWRYSAAAAALLVIAAGVLALVYLRSTSPADLATNEPYPLVQLSLRGDPSDQGIEACRAAFEAYNEGDFKTAARGLAHCSPLPEFNFFRGVSEYLAGDAESALEHLRAAQSPPGPWEQPAIWYEAHALLRLNRPAEARTLFLRLEQEGSQYRRQATGLRRRLETLQRP